MQIFEIKMTLIIKLMSRIKKIVIVLKYIFIREGIDELIVIYKFVHLCEFWIYTLEVVIIRCRPLIDEQRIYCLKVRSQGK
jgi:hypothetical protein